MSDLERKEERRKDRRVLVLKILIVLALTVTIGAICITGLQSSRRASNERETSTALKVLAAAEADFRANDRDWNRVNDFWTADVKSLYTLTAAAERGANPNSTRDPSIKLIQLSVAAADGDGTFFEAGKENLPLSVFATPKARQGYWFLTLLTDHTLAGNLEATYAQETGGKPAMGRVHNTSKYGFAAFPDSDWQGSFVFIVNENNTVFRAAITGARRGNSSPPGRNGLDPAWQHWPDDSKPPPAGFYCPQ
jgi:hypothetical protein